MKEKEISDNDIQILGADYRKSEESQTSVRKRRILLRLLPLIAIISVCAIFAVYMAVKSDRTADSDSITVQMDIQPADTVVQGYIKLSNETVNDVPLNIYTPVNAAPELTLSLPGEADSTVVFVTQAADFGKNNYGIIGDFVLLGEQLVKGVKKEGFCLITNQKITVGVDAKTPLLQEAIREKGYFFRQYPLVKNSQAIDNKPKGKSIRRALAIREGEIMMVESHERESFHDFACALADAGFTEAVYLTGGADTYGWYREEQGVQTFWGTKRESYPKGMNYLVWRSH